MYLHQFKNPKIFQYDTLTNEERWNDKFDVMLANPPFMSPKGGIKPHNKFGIQSNRSEVLFVDYIANHLKPNGRAGIIVPEGIIFQKGKAYKELRKLLVEGGLYAVVSLPSGVFQPYSGVKTSILLINPEIAKQRDEILFVKVANDGFDLGATKRPIDKNDLPEALKALNEWASSGLSISQLVNAVSKKEVAATGEYGLSGDRYLKGNDFSNSEWPFVRLEEVVDYEQPTKYIVESVNYDPSYPTPVLTAGKTFLLGYTDESEGVYNGPLPLIIFDDFTTATKLVTFRFKVKSSAMKLLHVNREKAIPEFVYYMMQNIDFPYKEHKRYWISEYSKFEIPLPPLEVQKQIVAELDGYEAIIAGANKVVENWKPTIDALSGFKFVELGDLCSIQNGYAFRSTEMGDFQEGSLPVVKIGNVRADGTIDPKFKYHKFQNQLENFILTEGDIVIAMTGATVGKVASMPKGRFLLNQRVGRINLENKELTVDFLRIALQSNKFYNYCQITATGGAQGNISSENILKFKLPLPPIAAQVELGAAVSKERSAIESMKDLIETYRTRSGVTIERLWSA